MKFIEARQENHEVNGERITVYDHKSVLDPNEHLLRLYIKDAELVMAAPSRGEALVEMADFLKDLSKHLRRMALEQEGCTGLTVGDMAGRR